ACGRAIEHRTLLSGRLPARWGRRAGRGNGAAGLGRRPLRLLAEQTELAETRIDHHAHDLHHATVVDRLVAADEDALVGLLVMHGLELVGEILQLVLG